MRQWESCRRNPVAIPGMNALVHFPHGENRIVNIFEKPEVGKELSGNISNGWIVQEVHRPGLAEIGGRTISVEVLVTRAEQ
jgi:hypothetical protein